MAYCDQTIWYVRLQLDFLVCAFHFIQVVDENR